MPEFRFRRKKHQNRRKTVHNPEETAKQIEEAKTVEPSKPVKRNSIGAINQPPPKLSVPEPEVGGVTVPKADRSSLVQEREKFFELLRTKYPEQASSLEKMTNGDEEVMVCGWSGSVWRVCMRVGVGCVGGVGVCGECA